MNSLAQTRRSQLQKWFKNRAIPTSEKSYISQLLSGKSSFGEKAARRLEVAYGMGDGYLDGRRGVTQAVAGEAREEHGLSTDEQTLLSQYRAASPRWRLAITLLSMVSTSDSQDEVAGMVNMVIAKVAGTTPDKIRYASDKRVKEVLGDAPHVARAK